MKHGSHFSGTFRSIPLRLLALALVLLLGLASCGPGAETLALHYVDALESGRIDVANSIRDRVSRRGQRFQDEFLTTVEETLSSNY